MIFIQCCARPPCPVVEFPPVLGAQERDNLAGALHQWKSLQKVREATIEALENAEHAWIGALQTERSRGYARDEYRMCCGECKKDVFRFVMCTDYMLGSTNDILDNEEKFHDAGRRRAVHFKTLQSCEKKLKAVNNCE